MKNKNKKNWQLYFLTFHRSTFSKLEINPANILVLFHVLQLLKKLKVYTELGPETVHKGPISIHIKIVNDTVDDTVKTVNDSKIMCRQRQWSCTLKF